jgi:hypothetical protein
MITDCHHDDLTAIINARVQARHDRKAANRKRYLRRHQRRMSAAAINDFVVKQMDMLYAEMGL